MVTRDPHTTPSVANPDVQLAGSQYERHPDAGYGEHIKNTAAICNSSASHTYGNVMLVVEKYLLDTFNGFSPDEFKTVSASTTLASRQLTSLPHQFQKREMPIMVLAPRIVFGQDDNRFLGHTLINDRVTDTHALYGDGSLIPLAEDKRKNIWIHGHYNRALMYVDIVLSFNTYSEQVNFLSSIYNMIPMVKSIKAPLELYIPTEFCSLLSHLVKVPLKENESVYTFLTYMNSIWHYPITYKLKGGSNSDEFFMYYLADIDMTFQDFQPGSGVKDGQIRRAFDISFTVRCEFNTVGYFTLNSPTLQKQIHIPHKEDATIVPIFTDEINLDDFHLPIGWTILSWPIFKLSPGENKVSIDNVLNQSLRTVIDYHLKMGLPMSRFIQFQFRENGKILTDELFHIDWGNRELILARPNPRRTYRLIITVSHDYINNLIKDLYNLE